MWWTFQFRLVSGLRLRESGSSLKTQLDAFCCMRSVCELWGLTYLVGVCGCFSFFLYCGEKVFSVTLKNYSKTLKSHYAFTERFCTCYSGAGLRGCFFIHSTDVHIFSDFKRYFSLLLDSCIFSCFLSVNHIVEEVHSNNSYLLSRASTLLSVLFKIYTLAAIIFYMCVRSVWRALAVTVGLHEHQNSQWNIACIGEPETQWTECEKYANDMALR